MQYHRDTTASQHNLAHMLDRLYRHKNKEASTVGKGIRTSISRPENQLLLIIQQSNPIQQYHTRFPTLSTKTNQSSTMAFLKTLIIASVAAVAFAVPQSGASDGNKKVEIDSSSNEAKCGNGSKIACCNSGEDLIGLNCLSVPIRKPPLPLPSFL